MTDRPPPDDWSVISVPVEGPIPPDVRTEEAEADLEPAPPRNPGDQLGSAARPPGSPTPPAGQMGPPGSRIFTLEDRPTPGIYLVAWLLSGAGAATLAVAILSGSPGVAPILSVAGLAALGLGLALAGGYQLVARAARPAEAYRGPSPLILFGVVFCAGSLMGAALALAQLDPARPFGFLPRVVVLGVLYGVVVWLFLVRGGALRWSQMGWPRWRAPKARGGSPEARGGSPGARGAAPGHLVADALYAAAIMSATAIAALIAASILARSLGVNSTSPGIPAPGTSLETVALLLAVVIVAPIGEELFFRGFALTAWWRDLGPRRALVRSSIFFALLHITSIESASLSEGLALVVVRVAVILPIGFVLGLLFIQRGMVASISGHLTYNGIQLGLYLLALSSGLVPGSLSGLGLGWVAWIGVW